MYPLNFNFKHTSYKIPPHKNLTLKLRFTYLLSQALPEKLPIVQPFRKHVAVTEHFNTLSRTSILCLRCVDKTWSLTLREEHRLTVFENRVLRRIFGPRRDEVMGDWRKLHNEELHNLYSSPNIIRMLMRRRMRCAGHVARMGETRNAYRILVGKPDGKRPLGRPRQVGGQY
jgi:hypothetical protein